MRIQHNIMAMNAYRNYNTNTSALSKNLEKLSSGYKINRAGDDAAGLAISEKMRAQITGLNAAQKNVKDGISLVKTAEGAMQEIQDMLNRMDYLATQSANGTYDSEVDRANLQKEVNALKEEINRIADSANFNGIQLLDGSQSADAVANADDLGSAVNITAKVDALVDGRTGQKGEYTIDLKNLGGNAGAASEVKVVVGGQTVATIAVTQNTDGTAGTFNVNNSGVKAVANGQATIGGVQFEVTVDDDGTTVRLKMKEIPKSEFTTKLEVSLQATGVSASTINNGQALSVHVVQAAVPNVNDKYAQGTFTLKANDIKDGAQIKIGDQVYTFAVGTDSKVAKNAKNVIDLRHMQVGASGIATEAARQLSKTAANNTWFKVTSNNATATISLTELYVNGVKDGEKLYKNDMVGDAKATDADWEGLVRWSGGGEFANANAGLTLQIGDTSADYNQMKVEIGDMHVANLGISGIDISSQAGAQAAIAKIRDAINQVSSVRGDLGAIQNRLEHTQNNLSVMAENIQDAESTIRDTDVAEEMMSYVKNNILVQSAQAMLAQANQVPQGVLQLLG